MNKEKYTYLLANPQNITSADVRELTTVIEKYPYFQSARALQLKGLKNENSFLYNDTLKIAAAHTTDRDMLFSYITSEEFVQNEISQAILKHEASFDEIDIDYEDVTEQTILKLNESLKAEMQKAEAILNPELFEKKVASVINIATTSKKEIDSNKESKTEDTKPSKVVTDAPLEFSKTDTHSFTEWLKLSNAKPIDRTVSAVEETEKSSEEKSDTNPVKVDEKFHLIEKFIQQRPKMKVTSNTSTNKNLAAPFQKVPDTLMTETLAKVYLQQKNYSKAIQSYRILILKYPEKSGFFADQIRAIEKIIKEQ